MVCFILTIVLIEGILFHNGTILDLCCIDFTDKHRVIRFPPEGLVIIEYPIIRSSRYTQFKQEMYDEYFKKFHDKPEPIPEVSCDTVLCWLYGAI